MTTTETWTVQRLLNWTSQHFQSKEIPSARLDAELLLSHALGKKRLDLYLGFDQPVTPGELSIMRDLVKRRSRHEPVAYILGRQEFYGRSFAVGKGVLIPRPETEHLIDEAVAWAREKELLENSLQVLDVASGSGCIAVTLACELKGAQVTAIDLAEAAYHYTLLNAQRLGVTDRTRVHHGNFDSWPFPTNGGFDIITSNPPYVSQQDIPALQRDVREFEPHEALVGGVVGSEIISRWVPKMVSLLKRGGLLVLEIGYDQGDVVQQILKQQDGLDEIRVLKDYSGHGRVARAVKQ